MRKKFNNTFPAAALMLLAAAPAALADVQVFGNDERDDWFDAVGGAANVSTVGFAGFPDNTRVVDQWSHLGVTFPGFDVTSGPDHGSFPQDGWGLQGFEEVNVVFDDPMQWFALDYLGGLILEFYSNESLLFTHSFSTPDIVGFEGVISDDSFDHVRITDPISHTVFFDDLHFGPPIPVPGAVGALAPFAVLMCTRSSRRRRL